MQDITVIIPIHEETDAMKEMLAKAVASINEMEKPENNSIGIMVVVPDGLYKESDCITGLLNPNTDRVVRNTGETDYCSQINFAAQQVTTEYFTIMEVDDHYNKKWFKMFYTYLYTHEDVSVFLPINVVTNVKTNEREFMNDIVWASSFSNELGVIDSDALDLTGAFNLTGGIFKTSDWLGYKPSIKIAFNYEYLLRATRNKKQKVYVIPKEGYYHSVFREGSLIAAYADEIPNEDTQKWFELAKRECMFDEDRNKGIIKVKDDDLK